MYVFMKIIFDCWSMLAIWDISYNKKKEWVKKQPPQLWLEITSLFCSQCCGSGTGKDSAEWYVSDLQHVTGIWGCWMSVPEALFTSPVLGLIHPGSVRPQLGLSPECLPYWSLCLAWTSHATEAGFAKFVVIVVQLLSRVWLFVTQQTAAHQASLSFTFPQKLLRHVSIESAMLSNHLILRRLPLFPSVLPSIGVFSRELVLCIRWPKGWSSSIHLSNEY